MKKTILFTCIFFSVLSLTQVVDAQHGREEWQPPEKVMEAIGVKPGMIIGEIGAGRGFMTFPLAKKVGESGKIYANDIDNENLTFLKDKAKREGIKNLETVLGVVDDPMFPVKELDMIILVYVFHDLKKPVEFTRNVEKYLKGTGTLVYVERDIEKAADAVGHFLSRKDLLEKMDKTNFTLLRIDTFLKNDNNYIFGLKK